MCSYCSDLRDIVFGLYTVSANEAETDRRRESGELGVVRR